MLVSLSKALDCINHDLLLAKLAAYSFSRDALKLIANCLSKRKQRFKTNISYVSWRYDTIGNTSRISSRASFIH